MEVHHTHENDAANASSTGGAEAPPPPGQGGDFDGGDLSSQGWSWGDPNESNDTGGGGGDDGGGLISYASDYPPHLVCTVRVHKAKKTRVLIIYVWFTVRRWGVGSFLSCIACIALQPMLALKVSLAVVVVVVVAGSRSDARFLAMFHGA
eukprot:3230229-Amphidinium_carterae.1